MKHHVVLDTNVLIAALRSPHGASYELLSLLGAGAFALSVSVPLVLEYEAVARRQARELGLTYGDITELLDFVCQAAHHCTIFYLWRPFLRDPNDDMVLEVAVEAQCAYVITYNTRDFAGSEQFGVRPITPKEFLALIREER
jgi:putative PIN family toxin of toxin-antitoxin system